MKVIQLLFALHVLFLAVYPCSDRETCIDEKKTGITFVDNGSHDHNTSEQDFCTPFCICACCAAHAQLNTLTSQEFSAFAHNTKQLSLYFENPVSNENHSIWQPPKLA
ncbi:MAG TPA: hypothetical protein PKJ83_17345 [Cyclobacteriaceae bacterium]|nr:hypothetical protein [Cyclobacteriaceae bacterium]HPW62646.1 hypothetical protein [Cyclobacteriaceae bacterium]